MTTIQSHGDRTAQLYTYLNRLILMKVVFWASLTAGVWITACSPGTADRSPNTNKEKEIKMASTGTPTTVDHNIPPIDAAASSNAITATFALG